MEESEVESGCDEDLYNTEYEKLPPQHFFFAIITKHNSDYEADPHLDQYDERDLDNTEYEAMAPKVKKLLAICNNLYIIIIQDRAAAERAIKQRERELGSDGKKRLPRALLYDALNEPRLNLSQKRHKGNGLGFVCLLLLFCLICVCLDNYAGNANTQMNENAAEENVKLEGINFNYAIFI